MSILAYSRHVGDVAAMRSPAGEGVLITRNPDGGLKLECGLYATLDLPVALLRERGGDPEIVAALAAEVIEANAAVMVASIRARLRRFEDDIDETSAIP